MEQPLEKAHWIMDKWGYTGSACIPWPWTTPLSRGAAQAGRQSAVHRQRRRHFDGLQRVELDCLRDKSNHCSKRWSSDGNGTQIYADDADFSFYPRYLRLSASCFLCSVRVTRLLTLDVKMYIGDYLGRRAIYSPDKLAIVDAGKRRNCA
ncbi:MAG: hypothetical protein R3D55_10260 [Chloroflexota bacterium]